MSSVYTPKSAVSALVIGKFVLIMLVAAAKMKKKTCTDRLFPKMGECREVLGGGPAPPSKL
jgi:hypothetical protein